MSSNPADNTNPTRRPSELELLARQTELLAALHDEIRRLREDLHTLTNRRSSKPKDSVLLSLRAAARRLGIDRTTTLADMIANGEIRVVDFHGRPRIPASELERICAEGPRRNASRRKEATPARPRSNTSSPGAAIRSLKL